MRIAAVVAVLACAVPARADRLMLDLSVGAPEGGTVGLGVRGGEWRATVEAGGAGAAFVGMFTATARVHRDIAAWRKLTLAAGIEATRMWYLAGSDDVMTGSLDMVGPTLQLRRPVSARWRLVLDGGGVVGRCRYGCDARLFVVPVITARMSLEL